MRDVRPAVVGRRVPAHEVHVPAGRLVVAKIGRRAGRAGQNGGIRVGAGAHRVDRRPDLVLEAGTLVRLAQVDGSGRGARRGRGIPVRGADRPAAILIVRDVRPAVVGRRVPAHEVHVPAGRLVVAKIGRRAGRAGQNGGIRVGAGAHRVDRRHLEFPGLARECRGRGGARDRGDEIVELDPRTCADLAVPHLVAGDRVREGRRRVPVERVLVPGAPRRREIQGLGGRAGGVG